jgi:hypothetical protein
MCRETIFIVIEQGKSHDCVMFTTPDSFAKGHGLYAGQWGRIPLLFLVVFFSTYNKGCINNMKKVTIAYFYIAL